MKGIAAKVALSVCTMLLTVTIMMLTAPLPAEAVTCWTNCPGGGRVECTGSSCTVNPGVGVTCVSNGVEFGVNCDGVVAEADGPEPAESLAD